MSITQAERQIAIETQLGNDVIVLRSVTIHEQLAQLPNIQAQLFSLKENLKFEDLLGTRVTIRLNLEEGQRFFNGYITALSQVMNQGSYAVYEASINSWLWFLTRTADCRIFQKQSIPEIIKFVFRDLGYTDFKEKLSQTYLPWDYCVQYRETDFNFVSRLMEQEGIYYYFEHENGKHDLVLADNYSSHQPISSSKVTFYPPDNMPRETYFCTHWQVSKQVLPGKYVLKDFDFKRPKADLRVNHSIVQAHPIADYEVYDYPGEYEQIDRGTNYVRTRLEELQTGYEQAYGQSNVRTMLAGGLFNLQEFPRPDQDREYLLTSVTHLLNEDVFEARSAAQMPVYSNTFTAMDSKTAFRPARLTPKPHIRGPQTAIVVGSAGEEIYTDEFGRVKLQFHWDRYGKSDENSSCWVRVSQVWAGKNWGAMHIPRIGQEVIVEFLEGDPDRPIITGRVYNGEQIVPYGLPANKTQSGIKSRSSKGGTGANFNEIRMEDKKGQEQLYIHAEKNQDNIVENDETTFVGHDRTEHVVHDEKIDIGNNRTETVGVNEMITIGNNRTESVGVNENITIGSNRTEQVGANETISIGSNRSVTIGLNKTETVVINKAETIGAAKELTIGGLYQVTVGAAMNESVAISKSQQVGTMKSTLVGGDVAETYGSNQTTNIAQNHSETIGQSQSISIGQDQLISVGKKIAITAGDQLSITVGNASLLMKKDGTIQINGKNISVKGSGKINVKADGNITMKGQKILEN